jgi:signal transduction histidine kinase
VPNPAPQKPPILLVDDRPENLLALNVILRDLQLQLVEVGSGQEAIECVTKQEFAAILLDVQMPIMDGFEAAKLIRKIPNAKTTPIIFVTAIHQTDAHATIGYGIGAIDYLFKPINADILKAKVSILVELYNKNREIEAFHQKINQQIISENENKVLKERVKSRDEFLSMASHELKTPITPLNLQMQSFLRLVRTNTLKDIENDRLERMLVTAYSQVERLSETIEKLLDVSRFSTGQVEMNFQKVNLSELIKKTIASFEIQLKKLNCVYIINSDKDVIGIWDPFRIEQVLINLLSNAMKYGPGKPIEVTVTSHNNKAFFSVKDHGIGIAEKDQSRIFERFERAASPDNYGGLGLGLYIACEIVRHHNGSIHIESQLGHGATFTVKLPLDNTPQKIHFPM